MATDESAKEAAMDAEIEAEIAKRRSDAVDTAKQRRITGWWTGGLAIVGVIGVIFVAALSLPTVPGIATVVNDKSGLGLYYLWTIVGAHTAVNLAAIYFLYQLLRAAERMLLPLFLDDIRSRDLTGVYSPFESLLAVIFGARRADPEQGS